MEKAIVPPEKKPYQEIGDDLRAQIAQGRYPVGSRLPPERHIAETYGVSRTIVREALLNYKFHGSQSRCTGFGDVLAQAAAEHFGGEFDLVTYVPVSKKRKQERGYDQSYLLARETCRHWSVAPERLLQKTKDNVAQSSLSSREERQKNVVGAYVAVNEDKIKGQRILLIDDILTTGATLREAARVLREAGAEKVICATLAAADED